MSYADKIAAARRQAILLALYFMPAYTGNRSLLRDQVERTGYSTSADLFGSELAWLEEMGLIELEDQACKLTARGEDVALGRSETPGVRKPHAGEINGPH